MLQRQPLTAHRMWHFSSVQLRPKYGYISTKIEKACVVYVMIGDDTKFPHARANRKLTIEVTVNL